VRAAQAKPVVHTTDVPAGPGFERDVESALPFCHAFPKNQYGDVFDGVMADDERVVAFRYKVRLSVYFYYFIGCDCDD
jgi:hypothetical protein